MFPVYNRIINCVRSSNLNFATQETPYSLYLTIRKSKVKKNNQQSSILMSDNQEVEGLVKENSSLKENFQNLKRNLDASEDNTKMLEEKLASAEAKVLKAYKENLKKDDEMKTLKNVIRNNNDVISNLECEKRELKKDMKKKVHDLEKSNLAHLNSIETLKQEVKKQKDEKLKLDKKIKQLEKKVKSGKPEEKPDTETNNNKKLEPSYPSLNASLGSALEAASAPSTQPASTARNILSPTPPPPFTCTSSPHTPPGTPPSRRSPSLATTAGTCGIQTPTSASTDSISQARTADNISTPSSAFASALPITEDYIAGINQIDLGPRVNDLSIF